MDDHFNELYKDKYAVARVKKSCELLDVKDKMSVLDVGCHKGEALEYLPKSIFYHGLDGIQGDKFDGGFNLGIKFDRILCLETLEHLTLPQKTLFYIEQHLNKDGIAVISLPNEVTLFHRIRSLMGTIDAESFSEEGKHLHLPNIRQSHKLVTQFLQVQKISYYINPSGASSRQPWIGSLMRLFPDILWQALADLFPSLFARGVIFVCKKHLP